MYLKTLVHTFQHFNYIPIQETDWRCQISWLNADTDDLKLHNLTEAEAVNIAQNQLLSKLLATWGIHYVLPTSQKRLTDYLQRGEVDGID